MNTKKLIARELILTAKSLLAAEDYEYVYDPDHKHKPQGGGSWEKTEKGWTQNKKEEKIPQIMPILNLLKRRNKERPFLI